MTFYILINSDQTTKTILTSALPADSSIKTFNGRDLNDFVKDPVNYDNASMIFIDSIDKINTLQEICALNASRIPIIGLINNSKERDKLLQAGIVDYLLKPLNCEEIKSKLANYALFDTLNKSTKTDKTKERLIGQILHNERLITMGRLISHISHEINNRMQAAYGAITLAREEENLSEDMQSFLDISQQETQRVNKIIGSFRHVYHPELERISVINVEELVKEVQRFFSDNAVGKNWILTTEMSQNEIEIRGKSSQLFFTWLSLLLNISDSLDVKQDNEIIIKTSVLDARIRIEFITKAPLDQSLISIINPEHYESMKIIESLLGLSMIKQVMLAHNGDAGINLTAPGIVVWMCLPVAA